jgi:photosystem II stability/assembly factor-like uncharacterized protein
MLGRRSRLGFFAVFAAVSRLASAGEGIWTTFGPPVQYVGPIAIDPADLSTLYAGGYDYYGENQFQGYVFKGLNRGHEWRLLATAPSGALVSSLAVDPSSSNVVWGLLGSGDLYRSTNYGESWSLIHSFGLSASEVVLDPTNPKTVYVTGSSCHLGPDGGYDCVGKVFRQGQGASQWAEVDVGSARWVRSLVIDPVATGLLYAGTDVGLFKSVNAGQSWRPIGQALETGCPLVSALAIDPRDGRTLLVGFYEFFHPWYDCGENFLTRDGGSTWQTVTDFPGAASFVFDPANPSTVYASVGRSFPETSAVLVSVDGGSTWEEMSAQPAESLTIDSSGSQLYASTLAGVFDYEVPSPGARVVIPRARLRPTPRTLERRP